MGGSGPAGSTNSINGSVGYAPEKTSLGLSATNHKLCSHSRSPQLSATSMKSRERALFGAGYLSLGDPTLARPAFHISAVTLLESSDEDASASEFVKGLRPHRSSGH